jgi:hypothetical protein
MVTEPNKDVTTVRFSWSAINMKIDPNVFRLTPVGKRAARSVLKRNTP